MGILRSRDYAPRSHYHHAFSLVELVMVVTILGIIAAIAVPRMTTAATNASSNALQATLANVRKVIDVYYAEHGRYPGYDPATGLPNNDAFVDQLLLYTDSDGKTNATYAQPFIYGPYLRSPFPSNPINNLSTVTVKATPSSPDPAAGSCGWVAVLSHGYFGINATNAELDTAGVLTAELKDIARGGAMAAE
jgi:prepilin-type N-terminal cleavage/methylation domain-containing protein